MEFIQSSWKAIVAFVGTAVVPVIVGYLPMIEAQVTDWATNLISAAIVAIGVWLKGNVTSA